MNRFTSHATRNRRRTAVLSVLASAALAAAACGSDDEGGAGTAAPSAAPTTSSAATPDTTGATDQQTTDSGATTSVDPSRPAGWIPAGDGVKGVTDDEIVIGLSTRDAAATSATAGELSGGVTEEGTPIDKVQAAIIDYINETGGIAGRQVKPVYAFYDITQSNAKADRQRQQQAMCVSWTEDNEVFAMVNTHAATHELWFDCARESETPFLASITVAVPSQEQFDAMSDYWYTPPLMIADHREQAVTSFLLDHGFFEEGAKVGLMIEDTPGIRAGVENGLKPVLDEAGIEIAAEIVYPGLPRITVAELRAPAPDGWSDPRPDVCDPRIGVVDRRHDERRAGSGLLPQVGCRVRQPAVRLRRPRRSQRADRERHGGGMDPGFRHGRPGVAVGCRRGVRVDHDRDRGDAT